MPISIFFEPAEPGDSDVDNSAGFLILRTDLLEEVRQGPVSFSNDLDISIDLLNLISKELEKYGTDKTQIVDDDGISLAIKTLKSVLRRTGIDFNLPFRDLTTFRSYWINNGMIGAGSWQVRRNCIESLFNHARISLEALESNRMTKPLANPASQANILWPEVDNELRELRRKYDSAVTPQDFRALGTNCIGVFEAIGRAVHDPSIDLRDDEAELPVDRIKERLDRYIERRLSGGENDELRGLVKASIRLVNKLKHQTNPTAIMAGIAADSTILIASIIKRLSISDISILSDDEVPF